MVDTLLVMRLLEWFRKAAYKERPQDTGATLIFPVSRPARYFYAVGTLFAAVLGALSFFVEDLELVAVGTGAIEGALSCSRTSGRSRFS